MNTFFFFFTRFESLVKYAKCNEIIDAVAPLSAERIVIKVYDVRKLFQSNRKKAVGPDGCSACFLKNFANELALVCQPVFQASVDTHCSCVMEDCAYIKPLSKVPCPREYKDFRPIALTSVIGKCLERLLLQHLVQMVKDKLHPWQFD